MKKKIFTLLTLLLCTVMGMNAQTYTDEASTVTWAFTSHETLTSTNVPADAFLTTNFSYGTNLNASTFSTKGCKAGWDEQTFVWFKPTTTVAKNAADAAENLLEWTVTPAKGITFTPISVSVTACTAGGTGDPQVTIYAVYSDDSKETVQSITSPNRPDKTGTSAPSVYSKTLSSAVAGTFKVRVYLAGLSNTAKGAAVTNIVVTGKVSGTPIATTTYTITAATSDAALGAVSGSATVEENAEVTLTATPTESGNFVKWQKGGEDFSGNTANPITVTATADATYTAVFEAKKAITFAAGEGTGTAPSTEYVLSGADFTVPEAFFLYKSGATLTGWSDGVNTYAPGDEISNVTENIDLTAQFTDNTVDFEDAAAIVNWTFARESGAPTITCEGSEIDYVQHVTLAGNRFDAVMHINTTKGAAIAETKGKVNNTSETTRGQVNKGTLFTIPVIDGTTIEFIGTSNQSVGDITFGGNNGTISGKKTVYTYSGATGTLDIVDTHGNFYPSGIKVIYPTKATIGEAEYATFVPTSKIAVPDGVKAYIATAASASAITLSEVSVIPANEPVIINGTAGTYYFNATSADASDVTGNLLKAGPVTGDGAKYYALGKPGTVVGFGLLKSDVALPATKAYIPASVFGAVAPAFVPFSFAGSETTAISEAKVATIANGAVYNLNGQRVAQPTKGLYIINGKKYMVK